MRIIHLSGIHLGRFDRIKFTLLPAVAPLVGQVWSRDQTRPGTPVEPGKAFRCGKDLQGTRWRTSVCRLLQPSTKTRLVHKFPSNWKRPPGRPRITWLNTVQRDLRAYNLTLNKAVDLAQNCPLWRLMSTYGAMHS